MNFVGNYAILIVEGMNDIVNEVTRKIIKMLADISDENVNEDIVVQIIKSASPVEFERGDIITAVDEL